MEEMAAEAEKGRDLCQVRDMARVMALDMAMKAMGSMGVAVLMEPVWAAGLGREVGPGMGLLVQQALVKEVAKAVVEVEVEAQASEVGGDMARDMEVGVAMEAEGVEVAVAEEAVVAVQEEWREDPERILDHGSGYGSGYGGGDEESP